MTKLPVISVRAEFHPKLLQQELKTQAFTWVTLSFYKPELKREANTDHQVTSTYFKIDFFYYKRKRKRYTTLEQVQSVSTYFISTLQG